MAGQRHPAGERGSDHPWAMGELQDNDRPRPGAVRHDRPSLRRPLPDQACGRRDLFRARGRRHAAVAACGDCQAVRRPRQAALRLEKRLPLADRKGRRPRHYQPLQQRGSLFQAGLWSAHRPDPDRHLRRGRRVHFIRRRQRHGSDPEGVHRPAQCAQTHGRRRRGRRSLRQGDGSGDTRVIQQGGQCRRRARHPGRQGAQRYRLEHPACGTQAARRTVRVRNSLHPASHRSRPGRGRRPGHGGGPRLGHPPKTRRRAAQFGRLPAFDGHAPLHPTEDSACAAPSSPPP